MKKQSFKRILYLVLAAAAAYYGRNYTNNGASPEGNRSSQTTSTAPAEFSDNYKVYPDSTLIRNKGNDGDSFEVALSGEGQKVLRLYFVDTPETKDKRYENHKKRVSQQAQYFGGIDYFEAIEVGRDAKDFVLKLLQKNSFTVFTKDELVYQGPRIYAFIELNYEEKKRWLHEILIEKGLARIHTRGAKIPNGLSFRQQKRHLQQLENRAKQDHVGAWAR